MENKVKELDDSLAYYMRACVNIPSISSIVEECKFPLFINI